MTLLAPAKLLPLIVIELPTRPADGEMLVTIGALAYWLQAAITAPDEGFGEGLGLTNTRARLARLYGAAHRFELEDAPGGGLLVTLEIPAADDATA